MTSSALVDQARVLFGPKLAAVEDSLAAHLSECAPHLRAHALGVLSSGGKRLRPILHLLSADLSGSGSTLDVTYATTFEYIHVASLLHDDVIDEADTRRGHPSLNRQLGNTLSVLVGDYLCVKALALAASAGEPEITALVASTTLDLVAGESLQELNAGRLDVDERECLEVIELKTSRLMAACCESGALLPGSRLGSEERLALRDYGMQLGLAFQLADDILDFASDAETLGKPVLSDLSSGKVTLPAVLAMRDGGDEARALLSAVVEDRGFQRVRPAHVVSVVTDCGALEETAARARRASARARRQLEAFAPSPAREALAHLAEFAVRRAS